MHIEAKRAAIELRDAIIDKVDELWCETRPLDGLGQRQHGLVSVRIRLGVLEALLHRNLRFTLPVSLANAAGKVAFREVLKHPSSAKAPVPGLRSEPPWPRW